MLERKQRGAYLTEQGIGICTSLSAAGAWIGIAKAKVEDMATVVAAPDASPPATVIAVPGGEIVTGIKGDALVE